MSDNIIFLGGNVLGGRGSGGTATTATNLAGGAANQIPYQTAASTTAFADGLTFASNAISAMTIAGGTVTTNIPVFSITRTNNNSAVVKGVEITYTDTTSAAGFLPLAIRGGAAGTTDLLTLSKAGSATVANGVTVGTTGFLQWGIRGLIRAPADGTFRFSNGGENAGATIDTPAGNLTLAPFSAITAVTGALTVSTNLITSTQSPASGAAGTAGTITWDASFIYICTATGVWKRVGITGGY